MPQSAGPGLGCFIKVKGLWATWLNRGHKKNRWLQISVPICSIFLAERFRVLVSQPWQAPNNSTNDEHISLLKYSPFSFAMKFLLSSWKGDLLLCWMNQVHLFSKVYHQTLHVLAGQNLAPDVTLSVSLSLSYRIPFTLDYLLLQQPLRNLQSFSFIWLPSSSLPSSATIKNFLCNWDVQEEESPCIFLFLLQREEEKGNKVKIRRESWRSVLQVVSFDPVCYYRWDSAKKINCTMERVTHTHTHTLTLPPVLWLHQE